MLKEKEKFLTIQEVADRIGFSYITVYGWVKSGKIPSYNFAGGFRVTEKDLETFVKKSRNSNLKVVAK